MSAKETQSPPAVGQEAWWLGGVSQRHGWCIGTCELEVELMDVVFETSDPANLLCMAVASFLLALADELCKFLNEVSNFCHASAGECRADHADDSGGEGSRVVIGPGRSVQQELLRGGGGFGGLGHSLCGIDNFFGRGVKVRIAGTVGG